MKRHMLLLLLAALCFVLEGCANVNEVENHAYALVLGVDRTGSEVELTIRFPRNGQGGGQDSESAPQDAYLLMSASGAGFGQALERLQWLASRELNLSQLKLIVVSEALAESDVFPAMIDEIAETRHLYTTAAFVVCEGSARAFIEGQKTVQGVRLSSEIAAMFRHLSAHGYIPRATFADLYYGTHAFCSDPTAIWGVSLEESTPAAALMDQGLRGSVISEAARQYLGAAVMKDGRLACRLDAGQTLALNLITGKVEAFSFESRGLTYSLCSVKRPSRSVKLLGDSVILRVRVRLCAESHVEEALLPGLRQSIEEALRDVIIACQGQGVEPFGFAAIAAMRFPTNQAWKAFDWCARFQQADIEVNVSISNPEP